MAQRKRSRDQRSLRGKTGNRKLKTFKSPGLGNGLAWALLLVFTLIAYANAWPDNLTFDDRVFVDSSRFTGLSLAEMLRFFTEDLWAASGTSSNLYRPLLLVFIASEAQLLGNWMAGYHLVNIGLHVLATILVYGFVRRVLQAGGHESGQNRQIALLAALIFGVHPIHTEVVNSVFNGSEILVCIGVVGGLSWFLDYVKSQPKKAWLGLGLIYLPVMLCRESGVALPLLAVAMIWLTHADSWQRRARTCIPVISLLLPLGIYLALRAHALGAAGAAEISAGQISGHGVQVGFSPHFGMSFWPTLATQEVTGLPPAGPASQLFPVEQYGMYYGLDRLVPAVKLWFEALKIQLWPHPLQIYYDRPEVSIWVALATQVVLLIAAIRAHRHKRPLLLIGLVFFYIAIFPSSRIIGERSSFPILADRILYLPSVGFTLMLAFGIKLLAQKLSPNAAAIVVLIVVAGLTPLTWARNSEWSNDIRLFESDYKKLKIKDPILNTLLAAHLRQQNIARAVEICDKHAKSMTNGAELGAHCGSAYGQVGRFRDAEQAYLSATYNAGAKAYANFNLATLYLHLGRRTEAEPRFAQAIGAEKKIFLREYFQALALIQMHPADRKSLLEAKDHLEKALQLQPQHVESRKELDLLNERLAAMVN